MLDFFILILYLSTRKVNLTQVRIGENLTIGLLIPTKNEKQQYYDFVLDIVDKNVFDTLILVDDSDDIKSKEIFLALKSTLEHKLGTSRICTVIRQNPSDGIAGAYKIGYQCAVDLNLDFLVQMDGDGQHSIVDLMRIIELLKIDKDFDVIYGSRWVKGGSTVNWSRSRKLLSILGNKFIKFKSGAKLDDASTGFRLFNLRKLERAWNLVFRLNVEGFSFHIITSIMYYELGLKIIEVPIRFEARKEGLSKMTIKRARESFDIVNNWNNKYRQDFLIFKD